MPIHPYSYRKKEKLDSTRTKLADNFSIDDLYSCVVGVAPESVKRRLKNKVLEKRLVERLESWKK